jgi:hypothetical protein
VDNFTATADPAVTDDVTDGYHAGSTWFNTTDNKLFVCQDSTDGAAVWRQVMDASKNLSDLADADASRINMSVGYGSRRNRFETGSHFVGVAGANGVAVPGMEAYMSFSGTAAGIGVITNVPGTVGVWSLDLGTTTTGRAAIAAVASVTNVGFRLGEGRARFLARAAIHVLSNGTETYTTRVGFIDNGASESADGAFFRYTHGSNGGMWEAVTRTNNAETSSNTGVTPVADLFQLFEVDVNAAGTSVDFKIDGVIVATITTNIPTAVGRETGYGLMSLKSAGTTQTSGLYFDLVEVEYNFTSPL